MTVTEREKMIKTEIQLPVDILYSLGIDKARMDYFVKKNFLLELYREGRIYDVLRSIKFPGKKNKIMGLNAHSLFFDIKRLKGLLGCLLRKKY